MNARFAHACDVSGARQQWQAHDWLRVLQSSWTRIECPTKFIQLRRASPHIESMIGKDEELLQSRAPSRTRSLPERVPCMPCHWYVSSASKRARITSDDVGYCSIARSAHSCFKIRCKRSCIYCCVTGGTKLDRGAVSKQSRIPFTVDCHAFVAPSSRPHSPPRATVSHAKVFICDATTSHLSSGGDILAKSS